MKTRNSLNKNLTLNALRRISLSDKEFKAAEAIVELFEENNYRANVLKIHDELFGFHKTASANALLNRLIGTINNKAEEADIDLKCCITGDKRAGAAKRYVWFESSFTEHNTIASDLSGLERKLGNNVVKQTARYEHNKIVVILTFNNNEKKKIINEFLHGEISEVKGNLINGINLGEHGGYNVYLVPSPDEEQGSDVALQLASDAWHSWNPVAILIVGIGYGAKPSDEGGDQEIGDVLISNEVKNCNRKKIAEGETIPRGSEFRSTRSLYNLISLLNTIKMEIKDSGWPRLHFGKLLSEDTLINDFNYRNKLHKLYPGAIGGEMEGAGLAVAGEERFKWILIKGISDFAKDKDRSKDERQLEAAENAAIVARELINNMGLNQLESFIQPAPELTQLEQKAGSIRRAGRTSNVKLDELDKVRILLDSQGKMGSMKKIDNPMLEDESGGVDALEALTKWADDSKSQPIFALLGEYGMGKTITCQRFVKKMEQYRKRDSAKKTALYFNLRDVTDLSNVPTPTLDKVMLECAKRGWTRTGESDAELLERIYYLLKSGSIAVFDGLDEVLVKLEEEDGITFIRTLLSVLDIAKQGGTKKEKAAMKVLISTRTQFFRTLREQRNHLTGEERDDKDESVFQAMTLLPFNDEQVREYLKEAIPGADIGKIEDLIESVHDLKDLTKRPITLRFISELIPEIERARELGKPIYGVTLYAEMVNKWLERDKSKHYIKLKHKHELAARLAAYLWQKGTSSAPADEIEDWLFEWIESEARLRRRYDGYSKDKLEEDLRNSTFLARHDESADKSVFRFSHTSLLEYFLAVYLFDALRDDSPARWVMPRPSDETFDFLGQLLMEYGGALLTGTMRKWAALYNVETNVNILQYALRAKRMKYPCPQLRGIRLSGAKLRLMEITLDLPEAVFDGADLRDASFNGCNLQNAFFRETSLTRARVFDCNLERADMSGASLEGAIFRNARLGGAQMVDLLLRRTQWLLCECLPESVANSPDCFVTGRPMNNDIFPAWSRTLRSFIGDFGTINAVSWSPDGLRLASGGYDGAIYVWDAVSAECIAVLEGHSGNVNAVAWSPDGARLASSGRDETIRIWDAVGECIAVLEGHSGSVYTVSWSPDGARLASGGYYTIRIWDAVGAGECIAVINGHNNNVVNAVSWSPDGARLVSCGYDNTIRIWNVSGAGECIAVLEGHNCQVSAVLWSPDGARLASAGRDGAIRIWDASGKCIAVWEVHKYAVTAVAWSPDGARLASGDGDNTIRVWDADGAGKCIAVLEGHSSWVAAMAWSPDGKRLASGGRDGAICVWDAVNAECIAVLKGHNGWVNAVAWSPDGARLASAGHDGVIRIWDAFDAECIAVLEGHSSGVNTVSWSPDGKRLASGGDDGAIRIWDASGELLTVLEGHRGGVNAVSWSPDGSRLASAGDDGTIRIWDAVGAGKCIMTIENFEDREYAVWNGDDTLRFASSGAWQWLGWQTVVDGKIDRLPAELFGPLPAPPHAQP